MTSWSSPPLSGRRRVTGTTDPRTCSCPLARTWPSTQEGEFQHLLRVGSSQSPAKTTKGISETATVTQLRSRPLLLSAGRIHFRHIRHIQYFPCSCFSPVHGPDGISIKYLLQPLAATYKLVSQLFFIRLPNSSSRVFKWPLRQNQLIKGQNSVIPHLRPHQTFCPFTSQLPKLPKYFFFNLPPRSPLKFLFSHKPQQLSIHSRPKKPFFSTSV